MIDPILIPMMALLIPIIVAPTAIWLGHARRVREMEHRERMKALEVGIDPARPRLGWPEAAACVAVGAGVPIGAFLVTLMAAMTVEVPEAVWAAPVLVSLAAIVASRKMFALCLEPKSPSAPPAWANAASKPAYDPDAYDVVGRRG